MYNSVFGIVCARRDIIKVIVFKFKGKIMNISKAGVKYGDKVLYEITLEVTILIILGLFVGILGFFF